MGNDINKEPEIPNFESYKKDKEFNEFVESILAGSVKSKEDDKEILRKEMVVYMGKIVVLEGTDFSGKTTQYDKLKEIAKQSNPLFDCNSNFFPIYRQIIHG